MYEKYIKGNSIIGIGTGSTIHEIINAIDNSLFENITVVASSIDTIIFLNERNIFTSEIQNYNEIDIYLDGADFYNENEIIKGMGGAIYYEKLLMQMSNRNIIFVQKHKYRETFNDLNVPLEVLPAAIKYVEHKLDKNKIDYLLRYTNNKKGPLITDSGNCIVDIKYNRNFLEKSKNIKGVLENGYLNVKDFKIEIVEI